MCWGNGCWKLCTVRGADRRTGDSGLSEQFEVRVIKMQVKLEDFRVRSETKLSRKEWFTQRERLGGSPSVSSTRLPNKKYNTCNQRHTYTHTHLPRLLSFQLFHSR